MDAVVKYFGVKGGAKEIVSFKENGKATLHADRLEEIIASRPEIANLPTIVVTVGGRARSGKSFLINLLISYLAHLEEIETECDWMQSEHKIEGVSWKRSEESITHGIWMFIRPFIVTRYDGSKAAVLLVDSQGTGDNQRSGPDIDALITYIGLQISSVQVLNLKGYLTSNDLGLLDLCSYYADIDDDAPQSMKDTHQREYLFRSLLFLIRDYDSDDHSLGEDPNVFPNLITRNKYPALKKRLEGIKKAFLNINSYKMPYPGERIAKATEAQDWKVKDVPVHFLKSVRGLALKLFDLQQSSGGTSRYWDSARDLFINFATLEKRMANDDLPHIRDPSDALQETVMQKAFVQLQHNLGNKMDQISSSDKLTSLNTKEDLMQFCDRLKEEEFDKFKTAAKYRKFAGSAIACKYEDMLKNCFNSMYNELMTRFESQKKLLKLQADVDQMERDMQEQNEKHTKEIDSLGQQNDAKRKSMDHRHKEIMEQKANELQEVRQMVQNEKAKSSGFYRKVASYSVLALSIGFFGGASFMAYAPGVSATAATAVEAGTAVAEAGTGYLMSKFAL